jgi:hypothetical protein
MDIRRLEARRWAFFSLFSLRAEGMVWHGIGTAYAWVSRETGEGNEGHMGLVVLSVGAQRVLACYIVSQSLAEVGGAPAQRVTSGERKRMALRKALFISTI